MPDSENRGKLESQDRRKPFSNIEHCCFPLHTACWERSGQEDIVQETFIRWQQASNEDIRSPRPPGDIISRLCHQPAQSARVKREEYIGQWAARTSCDGAWQ